MKLVQLLAKELKEWPETDECSDPILFITQDSSGTIFSWNDNGELKFVDGQWYMQGTIPFDEVIFDGSETCSDCSSAIVTQDQWQAEREKMNKPKWIRHRGGWMPVGAATIVEVRLRCGDIQKHEACEFLWRHKDCDSAARIMAYRIIEETKDQEIEEVKKTNFGTITYKLEIDAAGATQRIDSLVAKWGQIVSPLKWRDAIIHCQAIIEDCEREIERNVNLLDAEGLMMQKDSKKAMQHYAPDVDMSDWRNWEVGDIVLIKNDPDVADGEHKITDLEGNDYDGDLPVQAGGGWADFSEANVKFIRRP